MIVPGITDTERNIVELKALTAGANLKKIELLPYHTQGAYKWDALGLAYPLRGVPEPSGELMNRLERLLQEV